MKAIHATALVVAILVGLSLQPSARAEGKFRFPVGLAYSSGIQQATDKVFDFYEDAGFDVTKINIPVGLVLNPYYEWATSIGGIGVGVSVGPTAVVLVDEKTYDYYDSSTENVRYAFAIPVGAFGQYTPWPKATVAPYLRVGFKYPFAGGDFFESSQVGVFGVVGLEFWRTKSVGMSIEAGYDTSEIKVKFGGRSDTVTCPGFTVALSAVF